MPSIHKPRDAGKNFCEPIEKTAELIERLITQSDCVLVKKLANNDRNWAIWDEAKGRYKNNQAGPLLPAEARTSGFFPPLISDPDNPQNYSANVTVFWPATGKLYDSRFRWFSGKSAAEHHWTIHPRREFEELAPASYVLLFKPKQSDIAYRALTVDSADEDLVDYISEVFSIGGDFTFRIFQAETLTLTPTLNALQQLVAELLSHLSKGEDVFERYVSSLKKTDPASVADQAYKQWLADTHEHSLNPYQLAAPGNVLHELTRQREFAIYKQYEATYYGSHLARALLGQGRAATPAAAVASLVERFEVFYDICKSAKQARVSRAGGSFERHMGSMLTSGNVPHSAQSIFDGRKPDFILPSKEIYGDKNKRLTTALVLTLKTTLRERWTQVVSESTGCPIYLATLDEAIAGATLDKLAKAGITLVVPERFKDSDFTEYATRLGVITYRDFFDQLKRERTALWLDAGLPCF